MGDNYTNEIEDFIQNHERAHFLQSNRWANVKKDWIHDECIVRDENGKIKGYMSILIRKIPYFKKSIMYCGRGPVCDIRDEKVLTELTQEVKKLAKKHKAFIFRMDPDIPNSDKEFRELAEKVGYKLKKNIKNINQVIQPKYVFRLNIKNKTEEELLSSFAQKTRYNIRLATKKGVTVRERKCR